MKKKTKKQAPKPASKAKKEPTITPGEFVKLPLSEATRQVIFDIQSMSKRKIKIDMGDWVRLEGEPDDIWDFNYEEKVKKFNKAEAPICAVCAGGAAIVTFNSTLHLKDTCYPGRKKVDCSKKQWEKIPLTFDHIRNAQYRYAYEKWYGKNPRYEMHDALRNLEYKHEMFEGVLNAADLKHLYKQMNQLANLLEKYGK